MKMSQLFTKTRREAPRDEVSLNAQLLIRAGYIYKEMAGAYVFLPLGLKVLNKINQVIREEMDAIGGQEIQMTVLQNKELWERSGRWDDNVVDDWFKTKLKNGVEVGLGFTHEEPLTTLMRDHISSYRDLPVYPYQIQTKFRNELRAKSGIMRGREFLMKDLYSFCRSQEEHDEFYEQSKQAYLKVYERLGIGDRTFVTFASGGSFSKYSHEFQTLTEAGEDTIYVDEKQRLAVNQEVYTDEVLKDLGLKKSELVEKKAIEVGNIFTLGTKFSDALELNFTDEDGKVKPVVMGSYGIGPSRLLGTIVELLADDKGIVWPGNIAPAQVHLVRLGADAAVVKATDKLYGELLKHGVEVLFDDREAPAGQKFADADLIGVPVRLTVSKRTLESDSVEWKLRAEDDASTVKLSEVIPKFKG
jgi:prolyl-tRNA synthetase